MCLRKLAQRSVEHTHITNILKPNPGKSFESPTEAKVGANTLAEWKMFGGLLRVCSHSQLSRIAAFSHL